MVKLDAEKFIQTVKDLLNFTGEPISLHEPQFKGNEWTYVKECLDTGWVSSVGKFVDKFERDLADFTGAKYAIATSNGTCALHICFLLAGIKRDHEVLMPTMTFVATANALAYCGAIPHFIDAEEKHLGIDPVILSDYLKEMGEIKNNITINKLTGRPIQALCVMHTLGHPVDLNPLLEICKRYHLVLIEDAAEALGSYYQGVHVGHHGMAGSLSFNGNKVMTTGGGGAVLTNNEKLAKYAKHLTTTAKVPHAWQFEHDEVGYNYRLPNINAALGCAQLEQLPQNLQIKQLLAKKYEKALENMPGLRLIKPPAYGTSNHWLNAVLLDEACMAERDTILEAFIKNKIMVRPLWNLQHTSSMYCHAPRMLLPVATNLHKRLIKLPSSPQLIAASEYHPDQLAQVG